MRTDHVEIREVDRLVQQTVAYDRLKEVVREISHIEKVLQIVDRTVHQPVEIIAHEERLVEVPYILEKIV